MDVAQKKDAIEYHYDVGNEFYAYWLDPHMVYSCALWDDATPVTSLSDAQIAKIDWHLDNLKLGSSAHILDIGCGWGALLKRHQERCTTGSSAGLTLSSAQRDYIASQGLKNTQVLLQGWTEHQPTQAYDGIVSIGAFEHFADTRMPRAEKIRLYQDFFERCATWLKQDGFLSLQTIVYGHLSADEQNEFISNQVFPNSELPTVEEVNESASPFFHLIETRLDGRHYAKTCEMWLSNLNANKSQIIHEYGNDLYSHYKKYLQLSAFGFLSGKINLARFVMQKI